MNTRNEVAAQVRDLLAYFPGRGRLNLVWLLIIPIFSIFSLQLWLGKHPVPIAGVPYLVYYSGGASVLWFYSVTVLVLLVRMNHSERSSWFESTTIIASSVVYGMIIGLPALLVSIAWSACHVGISIFSLSVVLLGVLEVIGAMLLLAIILGVVAHYAGFFIALILFLAMKVYIYLLPAGYSIAFVPAKWRFIEAATPLGPAIAILRTGILNSHTAEIVLPIYRVAAVIYAIVGYALAFWIWKGVSNLRSVARAG